MADGCDPSPHPAKRRKTYASGRTVAKSPEGYGTLFGVSSALSTLSNKLLGRMKPQLEQVLHDDSAYGSKEESLNEDENVVVGEQKKVMPENAPEEQNEDGTAPGRKTRRSSRTSVNSCKVLQQKPVRTTTTDVTSNQTWKENNSPGSEMKTPQPVKSRASGNGRSTRKSSPAEEKSHAQRRKDNVLVDTQPFTSKKRMSKASSVDAMTSDVIGSEDADEGDAGPPNGKLNGHIEETVETKQRLSGRERRKPRRFSVEPAPAKGPLLIGEAAQEDPVVSPAKASSVLASPQPKGILTPSRRRREGPRKSVVFDENDKTIEERLGFKDIESPSKKARKNVKEYAEIAETPQSAAAEEDEDDLFVDQNPPKDHLQTLELPSYSEDLTTTDRPADPPAVTAIKALVLSRLTSTSLPSSPPSHLATQYSTLHSLLTSTIAASESNSLLLLGSRGSGKSMLIGTALTDLSSKHKEDFHIVRLDGFFQTDDRLALREIWRQLGREREGLGELDENETAEVGGSYADTMASLLSLLSHPDDFDADPIAMDLDPPTNQARASKSVIIILDEFDLFTLHPRQTLLYNLFDIAQSKKAPIAVIGCSTRMDVVECLEKRVKSRFSHRWVHVPTVKSAEGMEDIVKRVLCMEDGGPANVDMEDRVRWNEYIKTTFIPSPQVQALIQQTFYTTKSLPDILAALYIPIATLSFPASALAPPSAATPSSICKSSKSESKVRSKSKRAATTSNPPTSASVASTNPPPIHVPNFSPPSILTILSHLPTLHLSLLIAAARLETIFALTHTNLNATHTHYLDLLARSKSHSHSTFASSSSAGTRQWSKETCLSAWEDLIRWEVLVPVMGGKEDVECGGGGGREELSVRMVRVDVALEEVGWAVKEKFSGDGDGVVGKGVGDVLSRWCREE